MESNNNTVESQLLQTLDKDGTILDSGKWSASIGLKHDDALVGTIMRLNGFELITTEKLEKKYNALTEEGKEIIKIGSPEARVWQAVPEGGIEKPTLEKQMGEAGKIGLGNAMKLKWVTMDKATNKIIKTQQSIVDEVQNQLKEIESNTDVPEATVTALKKRKLVTTGILKTFKITKGPKFALELQKAEPDLTSAMLQTGDWKGKQFKEYNFNALGAPIESGYLHPLLKIRTAFRNIFLEMGFEEMPTNNFVESSFWNFDALFQPQQHPARDAHDTFFISDPAQAQTFPEDYLERVKEMHSKGGNGSIGWRYDWSVDETKKNILRTHTTAVSSRMLYKLAQEGFQPKKYFSIDRVFRNEALDATHLAEFHQVEGMIADYGLTLGNLMGIITEFFKRLGFEQLRFKPAYNPYTEPSMEVFCYHPGLKRWLEIGNSGIFRPEMLLPMNLPPDVRVIAWGLSLERPTMIKYGYDNIRDLVGAKVSLESVRKNPIVRFDK
eukprot:TRINITY_DN11_c0_g1_i1.p1 TRINITY_DN11_c0_g1~~TRINITY_DN11_c0_g1_i1.p1  ORF type:complete len:496 (-),score=141.12 TRINITY_DN11_c0_g1_i1:58-1545(-)